VRAVKRFVVSLYRYGERASERESLEQCNKGEYPLIPAAAGSSSLVHTTQHIIAFTQRSLALSHRFIFISNCLSPLESLALAIGNNEANKNAIICIIYYKAPRLFVPRALSLLVLVYCCCCCKGKPASFDISIIEVSAAAD
jgi:hypothetical protein